ncbi:MAG: NAD-dependent dihydropyrimidine dehydrogenase subunit PreA [Spirochaetota bacterium]
MDLSAEFCGLALENPFVLASAPPTADIAMIERAFSMGWAGAVTKTIKPDSMVVEDASPRFAAVKRDGRIVGFENFELLSKNNLDYWSDGIAHVRTEYPDKLLVVSITGDDRRETWADLARWAQDAGAQALELNFSCPHGMPERGVGAAIGQNPDITEMIARWVCDEVTIPVIVKLSPNVTSVIPIAEAAIRGGADALAAINTVQSIAGVDLDRLTPYPAVQGHSSYGGYSGAAVKPIGLRITAQLAQAFDLPLSALGGVSEWRDAAEYISLGANHVQVCTAVMTSGFRIVRTMISGLKRYMSGMGFARLEDFRGAALPKLSAHGDLDKKSRAVPRIDHEACTRCGKCVTACRDGAYQALDIHSGNVEVDQVRCDGCGLCHLVCPEGAIALEPRVLVEA